MRALLLLIGSLPAAADPHVVRMATAAPDGTAWAREIVALSRTVETATKGSVKLKWYLGGIAGDEVQMGERVRRDQLDGVGSGGMLCTRLAPSMRVLAVLGLFQDRGEASFVAGRLKTQLDEEFAKSGFVNLAEISVGPQVIFTRQPVQTLAQLKKTRLWLWDLDEVQGRQLKQMGVPTTPAPLEEAAAYYDSNKSDGFLAVTQAALAFQWSTQARYLTPLRMGVLTGCIIVAQRAWDSLPLEGQEALKMAAAQAALRLEQLGRETDDALLGGLFTKHGLTFQPVSEQFRAEFFQAATTAREGLGESVIPKSLVLKVTSWLADYRAEHKDDKR
jgi:TRAP-type C4-dicarboxylate transport system substrate-binding protein